MDCSSVPEIHYYLLDNPLENPDFNQQPKHDKILGVQLFDIAPLYDQDKIVYRESFYEAKFYNYHRWIAPPDEMITAETIDHITNSSLFKNVIQYPSTLNVDYILKGNILAFEEWDQENQWFSHIRLMVELFDMRGKNTLWKEIIEVKNPVAEKQPLELVKSINQSFKECMEKVIYQIDLSISANY